MREPTATNVEKVIIDNQEVILYALGILLNKVGDFKDPHTASVYDRVMSRITYTAGFSRAVRVVG